MTGPVLATLFALQPPAGPCPRTVLPLPCLPPLVPSTLRLDLPTTGALPALPPDFALRDDTIDAPPAMAEPSFEWTNAMTIGTIASLAAFVLIPTFWVIGSLH